MNSKRVLIVHLNGLASETLITAAMVLKKEDGREVMYTNCGQAILLENIMSVNGISFEN